MPTATYDERRGQLEEYFDRTAAKTWAQITSDAPIGRIRATVRAGRDRMRATLLSYLPDDMSGQRLFDAGCGTGALALEAARRGADVVAVDISGSLIEVAKDRAALETDVPAVDFRVGDMLDSALGEFDWVVAMDSLIHYQPPELVAMIAALGARARRGVAFTYAPSNPLLATMHVVGKAFPRGKRSPDIVPISERALRGWIGESPALTTFRVGRTDRIKSGFYTSQALELIRR